MVSLYSTIKMMHGPINIRFMFHNSDFKSQGTENIYFKDKSVNTVTANNNCLVLETLDMRKYIP